ncbi:MAG TPA: septal ring lytic transglycosylase RlpA family protein [Nitrospirota bacterium]|nr:septal ring lytic transglycosylase RlpA family protein [Nitrospirota bacterium]
MRSLFAALLGAGLAIVSACAGSTGAPHAEQSATVPVIQKACDCGAAAEPANASAQRTLYREAGVASWYGKDFQGKKTASGEVFDMHGHSAAHRTLPFGTIVRVTNLDNYKSINVRITDRGPFVKNRIVELSYGAAKDLGFTAQGTAPVKLEAAGAVFDGARFTVQAASYTEEENAALLKGRLAKHFEHVFLQQMETNSMHLYFVRVGSYASEERAEQTAAKLVLEGLEPFVLRKD